jgi:hypothetical protein
MVKLTKQTSRGEAVIEVSNGTAYVSLNGQQIGTSGMVNRTKPFGPGNAYVGGICKIALTESEASEVERMLKARDFNEEEVSSKDSRAKYIQVMREVHGNVNQFAKGGAL